MIAQFALRLVCGISLMWLLMPRRQITSGFFRIQMLLALARRRASRSHAGKVRNVGGLCEPAASVGAGSNFVRRLGRFGVHRLHRLDARTPHFR